LLILRLQAQATTYINPLTNTDDPDPGAILYEGTWYVATTGVSGNQIFPIRASADLATWTVVGSIFTQSNYPVWSQDTDFWAPEFHVVNGKLLAYFAARDKTGILCVGAAVSTSGTPLGPFSDIGQPLVRNATVGSIDPTFSYDTSNTPYVIWKEDGNANGWPTPIWCAQAATDGLSLVTDPVMLITNNPNSWEGPLVEAPWLYYYNSSYYLFYSANGYASTAYAIGVAVSSNILGPYQKFSGNPILHSNSAFSGPGHCSVLTDPKTDNTFLIYHSWIGNNIGNNYPRVLMMDRVNWQYWPSIANSSPSTTVQPIP